MLAMGTFFASFLLVDFAIAASVSTIAMWAWHSKKFSK